MPFSSQEQQQSEADLALYGQFKQACTREEQKADEALRVYEEACQALPPSEWSELLQTSDELLLRMHEAMVEAESRAGILRQLLEQKEESLRTNHSGDLVGAQLEVEHIKQELRQLELEPGQLTKYLAQGSRGCDDQNVKDWYSRKWMMEADEVAHYRSSAGSIAAMVQEVVVREESASLADAIGKELAKLEGMEATQQAERLCSLRGVIVPEDYQAAIDHIRHPETDKAQAKQLADALRDNLAEPLKQDLLEESLRRLEERGHWRVDNGQWSCTPVKVLLVVDADGVRFLREEWESPEPGHKGQALQELLNCAGLVPILQVLEDLASADAGFKALLEAKGLRSPDVLKQLAADAMEIKETPAGFEFSQPELAANMVSVHAAEQEFQLLEDEYDRRQARGEMNKKRHDQYELRREELLDIIKISKHREGTKFTGEEYLVCRELFSHKRDWQWSRGKPLAVFVDNRKIKIGIAEGQ